jgi:hypothetical protein
MTGVRKSRWKVWIALAAVPAALVLAGFVPKATGPILVVAGGAMAMWMLRGLGTSGRLERTYRLASVPCLVVGGSLCFFEQTRLPGALILSAGVAGLMPLAGEFVVNLLAEDEGPAAARRGLTAGRALALIVSICLGVLVLVLIGSTQSSSGAYYKRYGTPVEVMTGHDCLITTNRNGGGPRGESCDGSTWRTNGTTVTGTIAVGAGRNLTPGTSLQAYALGDTARTHDGAVGPIVVLGKLPWWLALPFPLALLCWLGLGLRQAARRARSMQATANS